MMTSHINFNTIPERPGIAIDLYPENKTVPFSATSAFKLILHTTRTPLYCTGLLDFI